jgi:hypothetical protein
LLEAVESLALEILERTLVLAGFAMNEVPASHKIFVLHLEKAAD